MAHLPDTEVGAAGVVAPDGDDLAGVGADVARPGLGDVQGAVSIQPDPRDAVHADGHPVLLPDVPVWGRGRAGTQES